MTIREIFEKVKGKRPLAYRNGKLNESLLEWYEDYSKHLKSLVEQMQRDRKRNITNEMRLEGIIDKLEDQNEQILGVLKLCKEAIKRYAAFNSSLMDEDDKSRVKLFDDKLENLILQIEGKELEGKK